MAFKLDDLVIDRIQMATAEDSSGNLLYTLTQLSEATIETSAESKEAKSAEGTLIKKFYQGKAGTFSAKNAMLNLNVVASASGTDKELYSDYDTSGTSLYMPKILVLDKKQLNYYIDHIVVDDYCDNENSVVMYAMSNNGTLGRKFIKGVNADSDHFTVDISGSETTFEFPTDLTAVDKLVIKYTRTPRNAVRITNSADKFPSTVKLTLKALCIDPCSPDVLRACYIILPSFQVSPELSIDLTTEGTLDYKGDLQVDYCSSDKVLYEIVVCGDDSEE